MTSRRIIVICLIAAAALVAPPNAAAVETRIDRHNEHIGLLIADGPGRWWVQNLSYHRVADVRRDGARRYVVTRHGRRIGHVDRATATVWRVWVAGRSEPVGFVRKRSSRMWTAEITRDGAACGAATGTAPIPAAAAVIIVWGG